jgi:hypothetical protein
MLADIEWLPCNVSLANMLNLNSVVKALNWISPIGGMYMICMGSDCNLDKVLLGDMFPKRWILIWLAPHLISTSLNKSSDVTITLTMRYAHTKLLDQEGSDFFAVWSDIPQCCTQLDFFFIYDFLTRYRQNTMKICHFCHLTQKTISEQSTAMNELREEMIRLKRPVARSSKRHRSAVSYLN